MLDCAGGYRYGRFTLTFLQPSLPNGVMTVYTTVMTETVNRELYGSGAVVKRGKRED